MAFHDGFGERRTLEDASGSVDHLRLRQELSTVPSFEFALRERASRLVQFRHPAFARVRSIEHGLAADNTLIVVSDHAPGVRLAELIARAEASGVPIDLGVTLCLLRQLVSAVSILHETARDVAHGAIAPERLIVTPTGRLVVTEYVLGSALEQLLFSRDRYWTELRIPVPRAAGLARLDHQADVLQMGVVALSLVLGRRLNDDDNALKLPDLVASAAPLPEGFRQWLHRALHLDPRLAFPSAMEARLSFERVVEESGHDASPASLTALLLRLADDAPAPVKLAPSQPRPVLVAVPALAGIPPESVPVASLTPEHTLPVVPEHTEPVPVHTSSMFGSRQADYEETEIPSDVPAARGRSYSLMAATACAGVAAVGVVLMVAWPRISVGKPASPATGTLAVTTDPSGAPASVDGVSQGVTPITVTLNAGAHTLIVHGEHGDRTVPLMIAAGSQVAHYLDLPKAVLPAPPPEPAPVVLVAAPPTPAPQEGPLAGWVSVTSRFDVQLFEEGKLIGTSESDKTMVAAGKHEFEVVNDELGYRAKRTVQVVAGKVFGMTIDAPKGTIALNAVPWAEVTIDGERAGETPLGNVSLPIGAHDVVFRNPALGEQRYRVSLTLKAPARLSADLRKK